MGLSSRTTWPRSPTSSMPSTRIVSPPSTVRMPPVPSGCCWASMNPPPPGSLSVSAIRCRPLKSTGYIKGVVMNHSLPGSPELVTVDKPLELGRHGRPTLRLKNRIVTSPMERNYGTSDGRPTEQYLDYLRARAVAGAGLITTEATFVREDGRGRTHQLGLHTDAVIASHRRLTDELHAAGALV